MEDRATVTGFVLDIFFFFLGPAGIIVVQVAVSALVLCCLCPSCKKKKRFILSTLCSD